MIESLQRLTSYKLAENRSRRNCRDFLRGELHDIAQELQDARCLCVGRRIRRNASEQRFCIIFQYRQLENMGRIEYRVRIFLVRKDVAVLAAADEWAVEHFLNGSIGYTEIASSLERCLLKAPRMDCDSLEAVLEADRWARAELSK